MINNNIVIFPNFITALENGFLNLDLQYVGEAWIAIASVDVLLFLLSTMVACVLLVPAQCVIIIWTSLRTLHKIVHSACLIVTNQHVV